MEPNEIDGATSRNGYKLFRDAVEGYKQLAIAAGLGDNPYYFLSNTEKSKKALAEAVIKAISDSSTGGDRGNMLTMVEKLGQTVAAALMTTASAHSYQTGAGNPDAYDLLRARYAGKLAEAQATLDNMNDMLGGRKFQPNTSIAWVLAGQSAIANAFETAANGEMGASEALAQETGTHYANLPTPDAGYTGDNPAYEATVEVEPSQINGLTRFTFRHFYRVFGCVDKLSGSNTKDNQLSYLVMALNQERPAILSNAIESIAPEFFKPELNAQGKPTGRIQADRMGDTKVRAILNHDDAVLARIVERCCAIKAEVVGLDEKEQGLRAILNYGHTFGHAIEKLTDYRTFSHGIAVALGMRVAGRMATETGLWSADDEKRQTALLDAFGFPDRFRVDADAAWAAMGVDKKAENGRRVFVLPERIGAVRKVVAPERAAVDSAWAVLGGR